MTDLIACPCTMIEQDEDCPEGYPSMICGICHGAGNASQDQITALAVEMIKIANYVGEPEDPFAAWETIDLLKTESDRLQRLFDLQWKRTREAGELWRQAHPGNDSVSPDLGELVTWLMSRSALSTPPQPEATDEITAIRERCAELEAENNSLVKALEEIVEVHGSTPALSHVRQIARAELRRATPTQEEAKP